MKNHMFSNLLLNYSTFIVVRSIISQCCVEVGQQARSQSEPEVGPHGAAASFLWLATFRTTAATQKTSNTSASRAAKQ